MLARLPGYYREIMQLLSEDYVNANQLLSNDFNIDKEHVHITPPG
jgi:hypothetical protein